MSPGVETAASTDKLVEPLTRKEIQVLQLAADGHSNASMASRLNLSDSTVRTHLRNINSKLSAHSRAEAVAIARRLAIIP
ncbi:response regulator transcription factor [Denitromonas sp.]|uniref:response regulator transcription factor n=1 Tax=Denitromonas sp. TaxID=2734609 RepID=UPI003A87C4CC